MLHCADAALKTCFGEFLLWKPIGASARWSPAVLQAVALADAATSLES